MVVHTISLQVSPKQSRKNQNKVSIFRVRCNSNSWIQATLNSHRLWSQAGKHTLISNRGIRCRLPKETQHSRIEQTSYREKSQYSHLEIKNRTWSTIGWMKIHLSFINNKMMNPKLLISHATAERPRMVWKYLGIVLMLRITTNQLWWMITRRLMKSLRVHLNWRTYTMTTSKTGINC